VVNSFNVFNGENLIQTFQYEQGCCGCGGTHFVTLTDQRILTRWEEYSACKCCCEPARNDASTFLFDIAQLSTSSKGIGCCGTLCSACCCCCTPRFTTINALLGYYWLPITVPFNEALGAKKLFAEAIAHQKPNARRQ
jgi:hypothetical protein